MSKPSKRRSAAAEKPDGYRQTVYLGLKARDLANLERVVAIMRMDPTHALLDDAIGLAKAARYAIAYCAAHPPAAGSTGPA